MEEIRVMEPNKKKHDQTNNAEEQDENFVFNQGSGHNEGSNERKKNKKHKRKAEEEGENTDNTQLRKTKKKKKRKIDGEEASDYQEAGFGNEQEQDGNDVCYQEAGFGNEQEQDGNDVCYQEAGFGNEQDQDGNDVCYQEAGFGNEQDQDGNDVCYQEAGFGNEQDQDGFDSDTQEATVISLLSDGDDSEEEGPTTEEQQQFLHNLNYTDEIDHEIEVKAFLRAPNGFCLELFGWLVEKGIRKMMGNLIKNDKDGYFFWPRKELKNYIKKFKFKLAPYRKRKPQQENKQERKSKPFKNKDIPFISITRKKAPLIGETCSSKDVPTTDNDGQNR
jgi:hypothetical protein